MLSQFLSFLAIVLAFLGNSAFTGSQYAFWFCLEWGRRLLFNKGVAFRRTFESSNILHASDGPILKRNTVTYLLRFSVGTNWISGADLGLLDVR